MVRADCNKRLVSCYAGCEMKISHHRVVSKWGRFLHNIFIHHRSQDRRRMIVSLSQSLTMLRTVGSILNCWTCSWCLEEKIIHWNCSMKVVIQCCGEFGIIFCLCRVPHSQELYPNVTGWKTLPRYGIWWRILLLLQITAKLFKVQVYLGDSSLINTLVL